MGVIGVPEHEHRIDARPNMITPGGNRACVCGHMLGPGESIEEHTNNDNDND